MPKNIGQVAGISLLVLMSTLYAGVRAQCAHSVYNGFPPRCAALTGGQWFTLLSAEIPPVEQCAVFVFLSDTGLFFKSSVVLNILLLLCSGLFLHRIQNTLLQFYR